MLRSTVIRGIDDAETDLVFQRLDLCKQGSQCRPGEFVVLHGRSLVVETSPPIFVVRLQVPVLAGSISDRAVLKCCCCQVRDVLEYKELRTCIPNESKIFVDQVTPGIAQTFAIAAWTERLTRRSSNNKEDIALEVGAMPKVRDCQGADVLAEKIDAQPRVRSTSRCTGRVVLNCDGGIEPSPRQAQVQPHGSAEERPNDSLCTFLLLGHGLRRCISQKVREIKTAARAHSAKAGHGASAPPALTYAEPGTPIEHQDPASVRILDRIVTRLGERFTVEGVRSGQGYRVVNLRSPDGR
jgi:hypothetical protein